jgi:ABC-type nitrate/sulfonate/bicarbonate transport system substrate-binding protein
MTRRTIFRTTLCIIAVALIAFWVIDRQERPPATLLPSGQRLVLAYNRDTPLVSPVFVALDRKLWVDESLDIEPQGLILGRACLDAVLSGHADVGTVAETPIVFAALHGLDFRVLCSFASSTKHVRCAARVDQGITRPEDLKGKRVSTALGTNNEYYMIEFLREHGLSRKDVEVINLNPTEMTNALVSGQISAAFYWEPFIWKAKQKLGTNLMVFPPGDFYTVTYCLVASTNFVRDKPDIVRKALRALLRSADFMRDHPKESVTIVAARIGIDETLLSEIWDSYRFEVTLDEQFLKTLDEEAEWARQYDPSLKDGKLIAFRKLIADQPLKSLKAEAVRIQNP